MDREIIVFIQAVIPETTLTSEIRRSLLRHCVDSLNLSHVKVTLTTRLAMGKFKSSPRKYVEKRPHGMRNLRSIK